MTKYIKTAVVAGTIAFAVTQASAVAITGNVNFGSDTEISLLPAGSTDFNLATGVHFEPGSGPGGANAVVTSVTIGSTMDAIVNPGDWITLSDFSLANGASKIGLWTGPGGLSFDLTSGTKSVSGTGNSLTYEGPGWLHATGYEDTAGYFTFTSQKTPFTQTIQFSFSAVTTGSDNVRTPDGGATAGLLSLGVLALGAIARRR